MITISFENCVGVFKIIDLSLMLEKLYYYLNQQKDVKELFDPNVFKFVIIDLLKERIGIKTFCRDCDLEYYPDQIQVKIGSHQDKQLTKEKRNIWKWMKGLFKRRSQEMKTRRIGRFGKWMVATCPKNHEVLSIGKWIS